MENHKSNKIILSLSAPLALLVIFSSLMGLLTPGIYSKESFNWAVQSMGQDFIDLFIVSPVFIATSIMAYKNNKSGLLLWSGSLVYLIYTFIIYCFNVHFNNLFIVYCIILGLSVYSFIYFWHLYNSGTVIIHFNDKAPRKTAGIYFFIIAIMFYFLWLSAIIPAQITNGTPKVLTESGLFTNPVHVLDLSLLLPGCVITGIMLLKKKFLGYVTAVLMLIFLVLMNITIGTLVYFMHSKGLESDLNLLIVFTVLTFFSIGLLAKFLKNIEQTE